MGLHKSYKIIKHKCCGTCTRAFVYHEQGLYPEFYCTADGVKRPLCGSRLINEHFGKGIRGYSGIKIENIMEERKAAWRAWAIERMVSESGYCELYKEG